MLIIIPISFEHESEAGVKRIARRLDGEMIQKRPSANVMANSRFIKQYKTQSVFYGCRSGEDRFSVFYHEAGRRDAGSLGFYGRLQKNGKGTRISSVASDIPKPMIKVEGRPVLESSLHKRTGAANTRGIHTLL